MTLTATRQYSHVVEKKLAVYFVTVLFNIRLSVIVNGNIAIVVYIYFVTVLFNIRLSIIVNGNMAIVVCNFCYV